MRALGIMLRKLELLGATSQSPIADHPDVAIGREVLTPDDEYQRLPERDVSAGVSRLLLPRGTGVRPVAKRSQDGATASPRRNADARSRRINGVPITLFGLAVDTEYRQGHGVDLRQYTIHSVTELAELALRNWRDSAKEVMRYVVVNRQTGRLVVPPIGFTIGLPDRAPLVPSRRMKPVTAQKSEEQFFEQLRDFLRMTTKIHVSGRDNSGIGGLGGTRTPDALLRTEALYPLSYEAAAISQGERAERYPNFRCRVLCPTPSPSVLAHNPAVDHVNPVQETVPDRPTDRLVDRPRNLNGNGDADRRKERDSRSSRVSPLPRVGRFAHATDTSQRAARCSLRLRARGATA